MAVTYKKLFHMLIDRDMTPAQLQQEVGYSANISHGLAGIFIFHWSPWRSYAVC